MLEAVCPNGHRLQVPLEHAGMKLRCPAPGCGVIFQLSASSPSGATMPVGAGAAPQPPAQPPVGVQPAPPPAPPPGGYGVQGAGYAQAPAPPPPPGGSSPAQPLSEAAGTRWSGSDQPVPQPQPGPVSQSGPIPRSPFAINSRSFSGTGSWVGWTHALLMIGFTLVLTARGCDGLGARNVARLRAKVEQDQQSFENAYKFDVDQIQAEMAAEKVTEKQRTDLQKRLDERRKTYDGERRELDVEWNRLRNAAIEAQATNIVWGYWREMLFVAGTILFALGLMAVGLGGQGAERYVSLAMLAIIVFSIYVGGAAWFMSIAGSLSGLGNLR